MALGTNIEYKASALFSATMDEKSAKQLESRFIELSKKASEMSRDEFQRAFSSLGVEINKSLAKLQMPPINIRNILKSNDNIGAFKALGSEFGKSFNDGLEMAMTQSGNIKKLLDIKRAELNANSVYGISRRSAAIRHLEKSGSGYEINRDYLHTKDFSGIETENISKYMDSLYVTMDKTLAGLQSIDKKANPKQYKNGLVTLENIIAAYIEGIDGLSNITELSGNKKYNIDAIRDLTSKYGLDSQMWTERSFAYRKNIENSQASVEYTQMIGLLDNIRQLETQASFATKSIQDINGAISEMSTLSRPAQKRIVKETEQVLKNAEEGKGGQVGRALNEYYDAMNSGADWVTKNSKALQFLTRFNAMDPVKQADAPREQRILADQLNPMMDQITSSLKMFVDAANRRLYPGYGTGDGGGTGSGAGSGTGTGDKVGTGGNTGVTPEEAENANRLAEALQRVEAAYQELDALSDDPWNIKNEEEINRILQERLAIIQRVGAENLKAHNPDAYANIEAINNEYAEKIDSIRESKDDDIYNNLDENFGYNNDIIESSRNLEILLAKRRELMQGIHFDAEQEYAEQEQINQAIERRIALMKQLEPLVANGSITQDDFEEMLFEQGELDERRNMLDGIQQNLFNAEPEDLSEAQSVLDQYEKIMVETASGKKLTLGPEMSEADWKAFMRMDTERAKSIEFVRKEIEATTQAQERLNATEGQNPPEQNKLVQQYNANKEKTLALLKKEQLSYEEILYLVKEVQAEYAKAFYNNKNYDLGDDASSLMTSVYGKLRRGDLLNAQLDQAIVGVGMSPEDGARILEDYQNRKLALEDSRRLQDELNASKNQEPKSIDETPQINSENSALEQQKKILNDVIIARQGLKASQTQLGVTDGADFFGGSTLNAVKEKQKTLKTYLQELTQIEAQEKKNGTLTEAEVDRRRELVKLVQDMALAVRYKDGSYYDTRDFDDWNKDLSQQIEQLNQIVSLRKQISLGYYQSGYGTLEDTFNGGSVYDLINLGSMVDIEEFNSSIVGQFAREYQNLHEQMLRCMLVGEEVPKSTLDRMKWFESVDASQIEAVLPKLTELQQKINEIQSKENLTSWKEDQDTAYYDEKIKDLTTLINLQKEYYAFGGPLTDTLNGFNFHYDTDYLQSTLEHFKLLKSGAADVSRLKSQFPDMNLRGSPDTASVVSDLHKGKIGYDEALSEVTQLIEKQRQLNDEKAKEPPIVDDVPKLQDENTKLDEQNGKLKENINLKAQANGHGVVTGTGTDTGTGTPKTTVTPTQTVPDGATSAEAGELEAIRAKVVEVTNAINAKNKAFYNEGQIVGQVVGKENVALMSLKGNIDAITTAVNTKTQAFLTEQSVVKRVAQSEISAWNGVRSGVTTARVELGNINTALNNVNTRSMSIQAPNLSGTSSQGNIANEAQALTDLKARIDEVNTAVQTKTTSFTQEEATVVQSVGNEINALTQLLQNVNNVNTAISTLSQGLNTTLNNAGAFNGINLNVNSTVDLATIEVTLANILTAIPNAGTNVQNNNAGGNGGGNGGHGARNLAGRIAVQASILDNFEAKLMDVGQLTPTIQNQIDQLRTALNNVADAPGLTAWMNQFRTMRSDMNTAGIISDLDTIGQMATRLGQLRAKSAQAATSEERASWDALIQQQEAAVQHMQQISDFDQDWFDNRALEAYTRSMEKYNDQMIKARAKENQKDQQQTFNQAIKDAQREAGLSKSKSSESRAIDTLVSARQIQGIAPEQVNVLDAYQMKIETLRNTIANFPRDGVATEAQKNQLIKQRLEVDAYTKEIQELIANYERLSGENTAVIGTSTLGLGASADAYQQELTQTIIAQTHGRAQIKAYDAETKTLTYTLKTGKGEFTQYAASVRQADGALVSVRGTTTKAMGVFESIGKKIKEYSYYFTGSMMIYRVIAWVREGVTAVKEIDLALTELKKVTDETEESYDRFLDTAAKTAEKVGSTIKDVVSSTADWARLGYSMQEAHTLATSTQILMNVSEFDDISKATDTLISSIQAFKYSAEESMDVVDIMNTIGKQICRGYIVIYSRVDNYNG